MYQKLNVMKNHFLTMKLAVYRLTGMSSEEFKNDYLDVSEAEYDEELSSDDEVSSISSDIKNVDTSATEDLCAMSIINSPPRIPRFDLIFASSLNVETNEDT